MSGNGDNCVMNGPVKIIMIEDDLGHAKLIERNIRRGVVTHRMPKRERNATVSFPDRLTAEGRLLRVKDSSPRGIATR